jgi:RNA polymerase sigma-70 factor (ECF subfamily)
MDIETHLPDESTLVERAVKDPAEFGILYERYFTRIYNYVRFRVSYAETTDDIVADVFESALTKIYLYRSEKGPFGLWLFAIARNAVNYHFRRQGRRKWLSLDFFEEQSNDHPLPEENVIRSEDKTALLRALSKIDDRKRDLVALKFAAGLSNRKIAQLTGMSESNVGVTLHRTIRRLRNELGELE